MLSNKLLKIKLNIIDYFVGLVAIFAFLLLLVENEVFLSPYKHLIDTINVAILAIFMGNVLLEFSLSKIKMQHLKSNWLDLIVFLPLIQFIRGIESMALYVLMRQLIIIVMLVSRIRKSTKFITLLSLRPTQLMVVSFSFTIGVGAILLMLPVATQSSVKTSLIDALFTATSATCVTGLIVKDTASYFSLFGQLVIVSLIQIGGLGIMTFSVSLALFMRKRVDIKRELIMQDVLDQDTLTDIKDLILFIVKMTLFFELIGAVVLFALWKNIFISIPWTIYYSIFHSISAFCNAGFSTFSNNLMNLSNDIFTNATICLLIIFGGLGFVVIKDIHGNIKDKFIHRRTKRLRLRIQTKIVLLSTILLISIGSVVIFFIEKDNTLISLDTKEKVVTSVFQSITSRTAGFNTCDISTVSSATLFLIMMLMFIGACPGSTAGGIKTTTLSVLWATIVSNFRQRENVEISRRIIPSEVVQKAMTVLVTSLMIVFIFTSLLLYLEKKMFIDVLFETISAFGTTGLSTGITPELSAKGKLLIMLLMFIGRLGPLTVGYAFTKRRKKVKYYYAEERVMIG